MVNQVEVFDLLGHNLQHIIFLLFALTQQVNRVEVDVVLDFGLVEWACYEVNFFFFFSRLLSLSPLVFALEVLLVEVGPN